MDYARDQECDANATVFGYIYFGSGCEHVRIHGECSNEIPDQGTFSTPSSKKKGESIRGILEITQCLLQAREEADFNFGFCNANNSSGFHGGSSIRCPVCYFKPIRKLMG